MKRLLSSILVLLIFTASLSACDTINTTPTQLPSSVDLRDFNGKNYVTPVKTQLFGDCWSFGVSGAAEISYLYANDLGVPTDKVNDTVDFSEKYNIWYVYHSITEDDVIKGKIRSSQVGEGYDASEAESDFPEAVYTFGGAIYSGSNLFTSGFTPVDENVSINGEYPYAYKGKHSDISDGEIQYSPDDDWSLPLNAEYRNPISNAFIRDSLLLPSPAIIDENGEYHYNENGVKAIKSELSKGHGVSFAALVYGTTNYENWATYNRSGMANHVITIVGYDDNYPKENFAQKTHNGEIKNDSIPPTDGAFIIKNSYGNEGINESGYFYMSYHDHSISYPISFEFDKSDRIECTKPNYDQYDMLMIGWNAHSDYINETKTANVFNAEEYESLYQIAYKTTIPNTSVHYEIYKNLRNSNPDSGKLIEKGDKTHEWGGYHKIDLKRKHKLKKDEKYSIIVTMTHKTNDNSNLYTSVIPYANSIKDSAKVNGIINKGESFIFSDGEWNDLVNVKDELSEIAYNQNIKENLPDEFKAQSKDDIAIDNFPIKGILIPKE
ncbi:MAG: hypothetical protein IKB73_03985 [Ruminococcus sp.]|nr:hypothetical protein [Ruminococcus sp.]